YTSPGIDFSASAEHPLRADMHRLAGETRYPFILILPQAETEAALERRLARESVRVERGTTLKTFAERGERIEARVERAGVTETIQARYIVGADG
ncbi:FAD-dependent monooxygenase, partial [Enterococcus faecium]|uniref:FAD-dependent monooxygenase n=1 Tax=Enterococcus faecium TaxID=1352 RepID=UPI003F43F1B8